MTMAQ